MEEFVDGNNESTQYSYHGCIGESVANAPVPHREVSMNLPGTATEGEEGGGGVTKERWT